MDAGKYTAQEIVDAAGFDTVEFGKIRVRIGGLRGIVKADQVINLLPGTVEVLVGTEAHAIEVGDGQVISDGARAALDAEGRQASRAAEEMQVRKAAEAEDAPTDAQSDNQE